MNRYFILCAVLLAASAQAETEPRCGRDAFGNTVCMDKDGVLSIAPRSLAKDRNKESAASAVAADGTESEDEEQEARPRCSVDPFGNTVCR
ncbi:MAG: hypothetical protein Q7U94_05330 [Sideroxyarcus sp.]|nr:hypothetical protein [Sideroxyarcus sp.]